MKLSKTRLPMSSVEQSFVTRTRAHQMDWPVEVAANDSRQLQGRRHLVRRSLDDDDFQEIAAPRLQVHPLQRSQGSADFAFFEPLTLALDEGATVIHSRGIGRWRKFGSILGLVPEDEDGSYNVLIAGILQRFAKRRPRFSQ
jgi:hypothetical protein